jgi:dephospho-CoA kinase
VTVRIGITGPIGCGKSTVAAWLGEAGATVIDADQLARAVTEPHEPAFAQIVEAFGREVVAEDGSLDRRALGRIVFNDVEELRRLEAIVHPAVRPRILAAIAEAEASGAPAVVIEAIRLVEAGYATTCDEVWLVTCDPDAQRQRLGSRGLTPAEAAARIASQGDLRDRVRPLSSRVIDTSGSKTATRELVFEAFAEATRAAHP